jgi:hypothetical protein
VTLNILN